MVLKNGLRIGWRLGLIGLVGFFLFFATAVPSEARDGGRRRAKLSKNLERRLDDRSPNKNKKPITVIYQGPRSEVSRLTKFYVWGD